MLIQKFDRVPWTIKQTFSGVLSTLVFWIAILLLNTFTGASSSTSSQPAQPLPPQIDTINAIISLVFSVIIYSVFLIAPFYYAHKAQHNKTQDDTRSVWDMLGFRRFNLGLTVLLVLSAMAIIIFLNQAYSFLIQDFHLHLQTNDQVILKQSKIAPIATYAALFVAVFIAPFCEEIFFRSFTFMGLKNGMTLGVAIVLSALIFGAAHGDVGSFPILFCIGLALALTRQLTGSYWPGFFLHFLNNGLSAIFVIMVMNNIKI